MPDPQIIQIGEEHDILCPVCGITIFGFKQLDAQPSCRHIRFVYWNGECFEYVNPELEALLAEEESKANEQDEFFDTWDGLRQHLRGGRPYPGTDRGVDGLRPGFIYRLGGDSQWEARCGMNKPKAFLRKTDAPPNYSALVIKGAVFGSWKLLILRDRNLTAEAVNNVHLADQYVSTACLPYLETSLVRVQAD
jgi:hypothetical protein